MNFLEEVREGQKGRYKGLSTGHKRWDLFCNGVQKKTYYGVGGAQKSGKTAFVDDVFVLGPYLKNPKAKINWIYFSFEIDKLEKMAKWASYFMDYKYGIYCDANYILSRGEDNKLSEEHYRLVQDIYDNEIKDLFSKIDFIEDRMNPEGIRKYLDEYARKNGNYVTNPYVVEGRTFQRRIGYTENDPELYTIIILDHASLAKKERGFSTKENIDKISEHFVWYRNFCKFTPVILSQFNRDLGKVDRLKFSGEDLQPTAEDFKNTGSLGEDSSVLIGLFNATSYPHLDKHKGYDLTKIGKSYRTAHILASRNTESGVFVPFVLEGKTGRFLELPRSTDSENLKKVYEYVSKFD